MTGPARGTTGGSSTAQSGRGRAGGWTTDANPEVAEAMTPAETMRCSQVTLLPPGGFHTKTK